MFTSNVYFYAALCAAAIGGAAWLAHDLRERGKIEAYAEVNAKAQDYQNAAQMQRIQDIKTGMATADAAMLARAAARKAIYEKAENISADDATREGSKRGILELDRRGSDGVQLNGACDCSDAVRVRENADSRGAQCAEDSRRARQSQRNIGRTKLTKLAAKCDETAADYNALLAICGGANE